MAACACHADWPIGGGHTAVVTDPGVLYTFGAGAEGQLGHRDRSAGSFPKALCIHGERVLMVACGAYHSACCTDSGKVFTWGSGRWGTLGQGDESDRLEPSRVDFESEGASGHGPQRVVQVSCGARHTAAVTELGDLWIWGMHSLGQLGLGSLGEVAGSFARPVMLRVQALERHHVAMVACGGFHTLAADSGGSLFAWGLGRSGQLGLGDSRSHPVPQRVNPNLFGGGIVFVAAGSAHSGAVTVGGQLYMWGCGRDGRLGVRKDGLPESGMDQVFSMSVFDAKNSARTHSLSAWLRSHSLRATPDCHATQESPVRVHLRGRPGQVDDENGSPDTAASAQGGGLRQEEHGDIGADEVAVSMVATGCRHNVAVARGGGVWVWGYGADGQLGLPHASRQTQGRVQPVPVALDPAMFNHAGDSCDNSYTCTHATRCAHTGCT